MVCAEDGRSSVLPVLNLSVRLYSPFSYYASAVDSICSTVLDY